MKISKTARPFVIRRARATDLDRIHQLNRELQTYERRLRASRLPARSLGRDYVDRLWRLDRRNAGRLYVATSPTGVIGFLACIIESDILESHPLAVQITDLVVKARWRGRGAGTALIDKAEEFAREKHARSIGVTTLAENTKARRAYRALEFEESAVTFERPISGNPGVTR
ncbi:MAG: N-acetyltransferase family protein [Steroidobacteraceae bacterium]